MRTKYVDKLSVKIIAAVLVGFLLAGAFTKLPILVRLLMVPQVVYHTTRQLCTSVT